ncbi:ABC-F family ATP-binding cassette domain-containing protein [Prochlorothrix hollandica]|uniref:ABC-F family ATP-binding cassette domain-containing protein n=1 Tax=Prochlorothrix hollandica TaxID=1223 RepID=UPI0033404763
MLRLEQISKIYPTGEVLRNVSWEVKPGDCLGLVGSNGAGKSTQLRIIMGEVEPTGGEIIRPSNFHIAYLTQEFEVDPQRTVRDEFWQVFGEATAVHNDYQRVQVALETAAPAELDSLIHDLDRLQRRFEALDGYGLDARIEKILPEMGFETGDGDRYVSEFSGGWQMRMSLGKILLQQPDLLLLDEPTNHLDLESIEWLEQYLKKLNTAKVIVSHDRTFLDRLCTQIIETERGVSTTYLGNYSVYVQQKAEQREALLAAYGNQQKEIERQQAFVDRFRASATRSTQAKSREKQLDKIERIEVPLESGSGPAFHFPDAPRSGRDVVKVENLTHAYGDNILLLESNLLVERGDRVALLGANGSGKSTLLRLMMGLEQPVEGSVTLGEHQVIASYFEQNQAEALDLDKTVMATLHDEAPQMTNTEVRSLLGRFGFSGDTVFKAVGYLSGGEKARVALAKMLLRPANLLLLDEPTNHLDIPAKEMLEQALKAYDGTVVIVSHDRYFMGQVANKIVELIDGELRVYLGNYEYYLEKVQEEKDKKRLTALEAEKAAKAAAKREKQKEKLTGRKQKRKAQAAS